MLSKFENNLFFSKLNSNTINLSDFVSTVSPFYYAVYMWPIHLTNFLKLLKNKLPRDNFDIYYKSKQLLTNNINDEYGIENGIQNLNNMHTVSYINFLHSFGFTDNLVINDSVATFNNKLSAYLTSVSLAEYAHILATIELLYIDISNIITNYCNANNICQNHFATHQTVDFKHANDLFSISEMLNINTQNSMSAYNTGYQLLNNVFESMFIQFIENKC